VSAIDNKELLLLCGAGISKNYPSDLPDARNLTKIILKRFVGKTRNLSYFENLCPEVIFQRIAEYEEKKLLTSLNHIFRTRHFNQNHLFGMSPNEYRNLN
jgi:hypothetical protein